MSENIRIKPTKKQLTYQEWEFGLFAHFGIRTFYEGHVDWDGKGMSPQGFHPTHLDCEQWIRTAKEAGMKYAVFTAKHHDGFANWPSKYTDYSVASTPWKNGKGDVVREFVDACRKYDIRPGLYYSPADASSNSFQKDVKAYDDYFIAQISEILMQYGEIDILWFDGCGSEGHNYDWKRIIGEIRRMQPNINIFNMGDPDFRWVGNEQGIAPLPCWNVVESVPFSVQTQEYEALQGKEFAWLPAECDCKMRLNWFYSDSDEHTMKSFDQLMGIYYYSVGRGANLLLNIGPDRQGLLPGKDAQILLEMGNEIKRRFSHPLATFTDFTYDDGKWIYTPEYPEVMDHVIIQEDLTEGESVRKFRICALPENNMHMPVTLYEGYNIGHKAICRFHPIHCGKIWIEILQCDFEPSIRSIQIFYVGEKKS